MSHGEPAQNTVVVGVIPVDEELDVLEVPVAPVVSIPPPKPPVLTLDPEPSVEVDPLPPVDEPAVDELALDVVGPALGEPASSVPPSPPCPPPPSPGNSSTTLVEHAGRRQSARAETRVAERMVTER